jgi:hypothetical protein
MSAVRDFLAKLRGVKPNTKGWTAKRPAHDAQHASLCVRTDKDEPFAVEREGPNLAVMLKGSSDALRAKLARLYQQRTGRTPGAAALADAMNLLAGEALDAEAELVHLRLASYRGRVLIDLGHADGRTVIVEPGGWEIVECSPVLFRRTALTGALPIPERGGTLAELRDLLNVTDESWRLIVGWRIAAKLPDLPHPMLLLFSLQGTGKSGAAKVRSDRNPIPLARCGDVPTLSREQSQTVSLHS